MKHCNEDLMNFPRAEHSPNFLLAQRSKFCVFKTFTRKKTLIVLVMIGFDIRNLN